MAEIKATIRANLLALLQAEEGALPPGENGTTRLAKRAGKKGIWGQRLLEAPQRADIANRRIEGVQDPQEPNIDPGAEDRGRFCADPGAEQEEVASASWLTAKMAERGMVM